jgi:hypothetical protein
VAVAALQQVAAAEAVQRLAERTAGERVVTAAATPGAARGRHADGEADRVALGQAPDTAGAGPGDQDLAAPVAVEVAARRDAGAGGVAARPAQGERAVTGFARSTVAPASLP